MAHQPEQTKDWSQLFANYRGQWIALAASAAKGAPEAILYRVPDSLDTFVGR
jgi:hypothetical protein